MKTKRYFNQILKPYKTIAKEIFGNYTDIEIVIGEKFCCYCQDENDLSIEIPVTEDPVGAKAFYEKMLKRLNQYKIKEKYSSDILSFLHEVGHIMTYNKFYASAYIIGANLIARLLSTNFICNSKMLTQMCYNCYFNLKLEKNADKWAMIYIKNHPEQVKNWETMLDKNYKKIIPKLLEKGLVSTNE